MKITWNLTLVDGYDVYSIQKRLQSKRIRKQSTLVGMSGGKHAAHGDLIVEILMRRYAVFGKYAAHFITYRVPERYV